MIGIGVDNGGRICGSCNSSSGDGGVLPGCVCAANVCWCIDCCCAFPVDHPLAFHAVVLPLPFRHRDFTVPARTCDVDEGAWMRSSRSLAPPRGRPPERTISARTAPSPAAKRNNHVRCFPVTFRALCRCTRLPGTLENLSGETCPHADTPAHNHATATQLLLRPNQESSTLNPTACILAARSRASYASVSGKQTFMSADWR